MLSKYFLGEKKGLKTDWRDDRVGLARKKGQAADRPVFNLG